MRIKIPKERAYYLASPNEEDRLLLWIPAQEYDRLIEEGRLSERVPDNYPDGLEVEVSTPGFAEFQIDVGVTPEAISRAYAELATRDLLPRAGTVAGGHLESIASDFTGRAPSELEGPPVDLGERLVEGGVPEPAMTEGEEAMVVMRELE